MSLDFWYMVWYTSWFHGVYIYSLIFARILQG